MFDRYHDTLIVALVSLCLAGALVALEGASSGAGQDAGGGLGNFVFTRESYFRRTFFHTLRNGERRLRLEVDELMYDERTGRGIFFRPRGDVFPAGVNFSAEKGTLLGEKLNLDFGVSFLQEGSVLRGEEAFYHMGREELRMAGEISSSTFFPESGDTVVLRSEKAFLRLAQKKARYEGNVRGRIERQRVYEEGMRFTSRELLADMNAFHLSLEGAVRVLRPDMVVRGRRGEFFLKNYNKKLKYFVLHDDVEVTESVRRRKSEPFERKAYGEKLEGFSGENKVVLTGYPRVYQRNDVIRGNRITLRKNIEMVEVDDANTDFLLR